MAMLDEQEWEDLHTMPEFEGLTFGERIEMARMPSFCRERLYGVLRDPALATIPLEWKRSFSHLEDDQLEVLRVIWTDEWCHRLTRTELFDLSIMDAPMRAESIRLLREWDDGGLSSFSGKENVEFSSISVDEQWRVIKMLAASEFERISFQDQLEIAKLDDCDRVAAAELAKDVAFAGYSITAIGRIAFSLTADELFRIAHDCRHWDLSFADAIRMKSLKGADRLRLMELSTRFRIPIVTLRKLLRIERWEHRLSDSDIREYEPRYQPKLLSMSEAQIAKFHDLQVSRPDLSVASRIKLAFLDEDFVEDANSPMSIDDQVKLFCLGDDERALFHQFLADFASEFPQLPSDFHAVWIVSKMPPNRRSTLIQDLERAMELIPLDRELLFWALTRFSLEDVLKCYLVHSSRDAPVAFEEMLMWSRTRIHITWDSEIAARGWSIHENAASTYPKADDIRILTD
jgi:hypothetical protein